MYLFCNGCLYYLDVHILNKHSGNLNALNHLVVHFSIHVQICLYISQSHFLDSPKHKVSTEENMYSDVFNLVDNFDLKCDLISDISSDLRTQMSIKVEKKITWEKGFLHPYTKMV